MAESRALPALKWATPLVGLAGGYLASLIGWPLPWMIGALLAVVIMRCLIGWQLAEIPGSRKCGQWIIGIGIGLHFSTALMEQVLNHSLLILCGALLTSLSCIIGVILLRRSGESRATAFFASMPGGANEMINLSIHSGAQPSRVATGQSLRLLLVVLTIPALFQWLSGMPLNRPPVPAPNGLWLCILFPLGALFALLLQHLKQPNPWLLGPLFLSAACSIGFNLQTSLPDILSALGQWLIGSALGCHFQRDFLRYAPTFIARTLLSTALMIVFAALAASALSWISALDLYSLMLGMMPGGIAELSLTAEILQLSVPLVTALQIVRLLLVLMLAKPVFDLWQKYSDER